MTFREGLIRARSHIIFLLALLTAFPLIIALDRIGAPSPAATPPRNDETDALTAGERLQPQRDGEEGGGLDIALGGGDDGFGDVNIRHYLGSCSECRTVRLVMAGMVPARIGPPARREGGWRVLG